MRVVDGIAGQMSDEKYLNKVSKEKADLIFIEAKAPIIKKYWQTITDLKSASSKSIIALMGDHVTALPEESMKNSPVDYVITGGDYEKVAVTGGLHR